MRALPPGSDREPTGGAPGLPHRCTSARGHRGEPACRNAEPHRPDPSRYSAARWFRRRRRGKRPAPRRRRVPSAGCATLLSIGSAGRSRRRSPGTVRPAPTGHRAAHRPCPSESARGSTVCAVRIRRRRRTCASICSPRYPVSMITSVERLARQQAQLMLEIRHARHRHHRLRNQPR